MNILKIDKSQVLRYIGYKGQRIDNITNNLIDESMDEILDIIEERYTYKILDISKLNGRVWVKDTSLELPGEDIKLLLKDSQSLILIGVTLGHKVDTMIRYYEKTSMAKTLILDACASVAIEDLISKLNTKLDNIVSKDNKMLTSRYSPGYGDLSIDIQGTLLDILESRKTIGLSVNSSNILIPRKSITAIIGIMDNQHKKVEISCKNCNEYTICNFSKGDVGFGD